RADGRCAPECLPRPGPGPDRDPGRRPARPAGRDRDRGAAGRCGAGRPAAGRRGVRARGGAPRRPAPRRGRRAPLGRRAPRARAAGLPATTIGQLETGRGAVHRRTLADLLTRYGVLDEDERADLLSVARRAADPGWWHAFTDIVPQQYESYLRLEQAASVIRS